MATNALYTIPEAPSAAVRSASKRRSRASTVTEATGVCKDKLIHHLFIPRKRQDIVISSVRLSVRLFIPLFSVSVNSEVNFFYAM